MTSVTLEKRHPLSIESRPSRKSRGSLFPFSTTSTRDGSAATSVQLCGYRSQHFFTRPSNHLTRMDGESTPTPTGALRNGIGNETQSLRSQQQQSLQQLNAVGELQEEAPVAIPAFLRRLMNDYARQAKRREMARGGLDEDSYAEGKAADRHKEEQVATPPNGAAAASGNKAHTQVAAAAADSEGITSTSGLATPPATSFSEPRTMATAGGTASVPTPTTTSAPSAASISAALAPPPPNTSHTPAVTASATTTATLRRLEDVYSPPKEIAPEEDLLPPENFAMVSSFLYRSSFPKRKNFPFLRSLGLKSVL